MSPKKAGVLVEKINEEHAALLAELAGMVVAASNQRLKPKAFEEVARHWQGHIATEERAMKALGLWTANHGRLHNTSHERITKALRGTATNSSGNQAKAKGLRVLTAGIVDHILTRDMELIKLLKSNSLPDYGHARIRVGKPVPGRRLLAGSGQGPPKLKATPLAVHGLTRASRFLAPLGMTTKRGSK